MSKATVDQESKEGKGRKNHFDTREGYLQAGIGQLRPIFERYGLQIPPNIRVSAAFGPGGRKSKHKGDCIRPEASADGHYEIVIANKEDEPLAVITELTKQLLHTSLGPARNRRFQEAMISMQFDVEGGVRRAKPKPSLTALLADVVEALGTFPHARVDWDLVTTATGKPRKQSTRMLKAECYAETGEGVCGCSLRISAYWVNKLGPPPCAAHGPMKVHWPEGEGPEAKGATIDGEFTIVEPVRIGKEAAE